MQIHAALSIAEKLHLVEHTGKVLAINKRPIAIASLIYCSWTETFVSKAQDGEVQYMVSAAPYYEFVKIPAESYVQLEAVDRYENGEHFYKLIKVEWADGEVLGDFCIDKSTIAQDEAIEERYTDRSKRFLRNSPAPQGLQTKEMCMNYRNGL